MSLSSIFAAMAEQDIVKEAEAYGDGMLYEEDVLEKAAAYDAIGRRFAHQVLAQQLGIELEKEAMGLPPALIAAAAQKGEGKGEDEDEEDEGSKADKKEDADEAKKKALLAKMQEKKAAVIDAMYNDEEYLSYIVDKYVDFGE